MNLCVICGQKKRLTRGYKLRKTRFIEKLKFWKQIHVGFCFPCWVKSMIQIRTLFKNQKERFEIYLRMCEK